MSFANLPGHQLTGPIGIAADFSGRVQSPQFTGVVRANNLTYRQRDLRHADHQPRHRRPLQRLAARDRPAFRPRRPRHRRAATARSASPRRPASRSTSRSSSRTPSSRAATTSPAPRPAISTSSTTAAAPRSRGTLDLGEVRYQIVRQAAAEVPQLAGVRRRGEPLRPPNEQNADKGVPSIWRLDLRLQRQQPGLRLGHGPRIRMARRSARPGHDRDARDRRQGRSDPRHLGPRRPPLPADPAAMSSSPATRPPNPQHRPRARPATSRASQVGIIVSRQLQQPADRLHLLAGPAAGRDRLADPVRQLGDRRFRRCRRSSSPRR